MKLATFDYTDLKGKESHRKLLVTGSPTNKLSGIDVTEYNDEDIGMFSAALEALQDNHQKEVEKLKEEFDLKHNYRQFLEMSIRNRVDEDI